MSDENSETRRGNIALVKKCGAKLRRKDRHCQGLAMKNGRCRLHGGLSTGPKTPEGRERCRRAGLIHGRYCKRLTREGRLATSAVMP